MIVVDVFEGWDMRKRHELRGHRRSRALRPGQCVLAINTSETQACVVDCEGGLHIYYAPPEMILDLESIRDLMRSGLGLRLDISGFRRIDLVA